MKLVFLTVFYFGVFMTVIVMNSMGGPEEALRIVQTDPSAIVIVAIVNLVAAHGVYLFWRNARGTRSLQTAGGSNISFDQMVFRHPKILMMLLVLTGVFAMLGAGDATMISTIAKNPPAAPLGAAILLAMGNVVLFRVATLYEKMRYLCAAAFICGFIWHFV